MNNIFTIVSSDLRKTVADATPLLLKLDNTETSQRPSLTKWAKKEILGHLLDSASNNHQRFVRAAIQNSLNFPGYEQDKLVDLQQFKQMDWEFLVDHWANYNNFLAQVLAYLPEQASNINCVIGGNKPTTLAWIAKDYVEHIKHHLNQIIGEKFETTYGTVPTMAD